MGTHGSRGWGEFFMGSNIEKVRTCPVPVFAVRGYINLLSISDIVFLCNLKLDQSDVISKVKELQKEFHSRLHLLRINTGKSLNHIKITNKLEEYACHYQLSNYTVTVFNEAKIKDGILHFAREINADMIAMVTHGKLDIRHLFIESVTAAIVNHAKIFGVDLFDLNFHYPQAAVSLDKISEYDLIHHHRLFSEPNSLA